MKSCLKVALLVFTFCIVAAAGDGEDGYISIKADTWTLGTTKVERKIALRQGRFFTTSLKNKITGRELLPVGMVSEELRVVVDGKDISGTSGGWRLVKASDSTLANGEKQLDITLIHDDLQATKTYMVYPGTSVIREWVQFRNVGAVSLRISEPQFLGFAAKVAAPGSVKLHWMSGGENRPGAWTLNSEDLKPGELREFDSYDPFGGTAKGNFVGDGVKARVLHDDEQIWPVKDWLDKKWQDVLNADAKIPLDVEAEVAAGDRLVFIVNRFGTTDADLTAFDPTITYTDGETHRASEEFSNEQGKNGWRYQYAYAGTFGDPDLARFYESLPLSHQSEETLHITMGDLVYDDATKLWRDPTDKSTESLLVSPNQVQPGLSRDVARVWIAPKTGKVRITATLSNTANQARPAAFRSYRMGTSSYAPWTALADANGGGLFVGWDYFGHWASDFTEAEDGSVSVKFRVAGHSQDLKPGESLTTPMAFVGLFKGDLDDAGNETLDWQYRYLWDYTREGWFGAMRQGGWWWKGTGWPDPRNSRLAGKRPLVLTGLEGSDQESTYRMVFRMADYISEIGADVYHRDFGWWDRMGDWDGPDWKSTGAYLQKHGMGQLIYVPFLVVDPKSKVAKEHPDWLVNNVLDASNPQVVEFLTQQLDDLAQRFGQFELKNDGPLTTVHNADDTSLLRQDQALRGIIRQFLDEHPGYAFEACDGGGNEVGYDYVRYTSSISFSDGAVGMLRNYWASLVIPPDKTAENGDLWEVNKFEKGTYRGLLTIAFDNAGDTWEPQRVEGMRELIDIYHYLGSQGVAGRWVHVYRPLIAGDDATMYFERLSRDGKRGIIIPKRPAPGAVTIKPKGLLADESYLVSYQESEESQNRKGSELMENGISLDKMAPGELIYLNLPYHPGNRLDANPPLPPSDIRKAGATNMGYPGIELTWQPGHDDHWVSYYEVLRDGAIIDKVAKGTYYFDHSAGADLAAVYEVRTVDGAGLRSNLVVAKGLAANRTLVLDDAAKVGITFSGNWERQADLQPAYRGTISRSHDKGASFEFEFEGTKFTWFTKLGDDGGKAGVSIDDQPDVVVTTYSADDVWGVGVYSKTFPVAGKHKVRISVLGEPPDAYGRGTSVYVDGIRIER